MVAAMFRPCFRVLHKSLRFLNVSVDFQPTRALQCSSCLLTPRQTSKNPSPAIAGRYQILDEADARVIENTSDELPDDRYPILSDEFDEINLTRGKTGVFEIDDLVNVLQRENAQNIFVVTVPREINYVDYICVVSGKGRRHMVAIAEFVRRVFKKKCRPTDVLPKIEGKGSEDWMALDLGNIALHIFSAKIRETYDLETLWAVGPEFDDQINRKDKDVANLLESYTTYLQDLKPKE